MNKRGQITLFIILGILLIAGVVLFLVMKDDLFNVVGGDERFIEDSDAREVYVFVKDCFSTVSQESLFFFGYEGGRTGFFPEVYGYGIYDVPYYYYEGISYMPAEEEVTQDILAKYIDENMPLCINDFEAFPNLDIRHQEMKTSVEIGERSVIFNQDYDVKVYKGDNVIDVGPDFRFEFDVRLREMLDIAKTVVENQLKNELFIHWDYITDKTNKDYQITAFTEEDNTIVYRILDEENMLYEQPYLLQFANKYYIKES